MPMTAVRTLLLLTIVALTTGGCRTVYYSTMDKFGYEKRDILKSRVEDARDSQNAAKEQFKTTLERFQEVTNFQGGDLEAKYKKLNSAYESASSRAQAVRDRIASVETVAGDMFKEWKTELNDYSNAELKRSSDQKLNETRARYDQLVAAMQKAEQRMDPVLAVFKDQVLYLKHNLNAAAISSLQTTTASVEEDVSQLITEMEASINEANDFMKQLK